MTIKQPITLSNGRTFTFRLLPNGANEIIEDMSNDEWEEYCAICVSNIRRLAEETEAARKLANQKWHDVTERKCPYCGGTPGATGGLMCCVKDW